MSFQLFRAALWTIPFFFTRHPNPHPAILLVPRKRDTFPLRCVCYSLAPISPHYPSQHPQALALPLVAADSSHTPPHYRVVLSCQMERDTPILQASLYMHYLSLCMSFQDGAVFHCISSFISDTVTCLHHGDVKTSLTTLKRIYCTTYEFCFHSNA